MGITKFSQVQADQFLGSQAEASPFGKIWYVDSTNGADGNSGDSPEEAKSSVAGVIAVMKGNRGDTAVFYPGTYTITTALVPVAFTTFKAAVVVPQNPSVKISGNVAELVTLDVSGVRFIGIEFLNTGTTTRDLVDIADGASVAGVVFEDCVFNGGAKGSGSAYHNGQCGIRIKDGTYTTTGLVIRRCLFRQLGKTCVDVGVLGIPSAKIEDNSFNLYTPSGVGIRLEDTGAVATGKGFVIRNNDFVGTTSTTDIGIVIAGTEETTAFGMIRNNYFAACLAASVTANKIEDCIINNYYGDATGGAVVDSGT